MTTLMAVLYPSRADWRRRPTWRRALRVCCAFLAAWAVTPSALAGAQDSRVEVIAREQAERAAQVAPETPSRGEQVVRRVLSSPLLAGTGGVYPWFGSIANGTGFAAGAGVLRRGAHGSRVNAMGAASINGSLLADASWRLPGLGAEHTIRPRIDARWSRQNELPYYGVGPDTTPADLATYDVEPFNITGGLELPLTRRLTVGAGAGYQGLSTAGPFVPTRPLPGLGASIEFIVTHAEATFDWRPAVGYSTRGGYLRGDWQHFAARGGAPHSFERLELEAAQLIPLVREQFGLAFRALATTTEPRSGGSVPFMLLPSIGGGDTVRGLANRRFHDRSRVVVNAEYRWRPSRYLDMALFADAGAVGPGLDAIDRRDVETAYGIGARIHGPTFSVLRLDVARGREGWRVVFGASQPF